MPKITLELVDGGEFQYNSSLKELYRIINKDGTSTLKLEGCPEVVIKTIKHTNKKDNYVVDIYHLIINDPTQFTELSGKVIAALQRSYPYLYAHISPVTLNDTLVKVQGFANKDMLYCAPADDQSFLLFLTGDKKSKDVKFYEDNMLGHVDVPLLRGFTDGAIAELGDPVIYQVQGICKWRRPVAERIAKRLKLNYTYW